MKALFRKETPGLSCYAALVLFGVAYVSAMAMVVAPDHVRAAFDRPANWPENRQAD